MELEKSQVVNPVGQEKKIPASPPSQPKTHHTKKYLLIGAIFLALIIMTSVGYILGMKNNNKLVPPTEPTATPSVPSSAILPPSVAVTLNPTDSGIPINANTVSFTRVTGQVYLRYKGKIYNEEAASKNDPTITKLANPDSYTWYGLVDAPNTIPTEMSGFDELFDLKVFPNKYNFAFVMRWPNAENKTDYKVFFYDAYATSNKVSEILTMIQGGNGNEYNVPRFKQVSADGKYVAFNMFACWNCGGHSPDTMLFTMETKTTKRIGKVSYFSWKTNGSYEYKEYKTKPCDMEGPGECSEEPDTMPLLTGTL